MAAPRIVDLSTPIVTDHFRWPVERHLARSHAEGDHVDATWAGWIVHGFTHMDAPRHFDPAGGTTDDVPLDKVVGEAAVIDVSHIEPKGAVTREVVEAAGGHVRAGDIALLRARWDERRSISEPAFWADAPYVTADAAIWLRERSVKAVGFDFPQDYSIRFFLTGEPRPPTEEHPTHYHLLMQGVILLEYLCNLGAIAGERTFLVALPLKLPGADGAPARVIALEK